MCKQCYLQLAKHNWWLVLCVWYSHFLRIFLLTSKSSCQILKIVSFVSDWGWHLCTSDQLTLRNVGNQSTEKSTCLMQMLVIICRQNAHFHETLYFLCHKSDQREISLKILSRKQLCISVWRWALLCESLFHWNDYNLCWKMTIDWSILNRSTRG